jgi:hypothetical protein
MSRTSGASLAKWTAQRDNMQHPTRAHYTTSKLHQCNWVLHRA